MKICLHSVGLSQSAGYSGTVTSDQATLSLEGVMAKALRFDGITLAAKRPHALPFDLSAGNTPLEETAVALRTLYGQHLGLRYDKLRELSLLVRELSGIEEPSNRPIVGDTLFDMEAGIITGWYNNCGAEHLLEVFPFRPELVGHEAEQVILGKKSGGASIDIWLEAMEMDADPEQRREILRQVKLLGIQKKGPISELDFRAIVDEVTQE